MGGYIRLDKDLKDDPRVLAIADAIHELAETLPNEDVRALLADLACNAAIGGLFKLWRYADTHLGRHNRFKSQLHGLARIAEVTALPVEVLEAFPTEWLKEHADGTIELPDYSGKNNLIDRDIRREKTRDRVRRWRERQKKGTHEGNGKDHVTPEPLQRYASATTGPGPGPGTGPVPTGPGSGTVPDAAPLAADPERAAAAREKLRELATSMRMPSAPAKGAA